MSKNNCFYFLVHCVLTDQYEREWWLLVIDQFTKNIEVSLSLFGILKTKHCLFWKKRGVKIGSALVTFLLLTKLIILKTPINKYCITITLVLLLSIFVGKIGTCLSFLCRTPLKSLCEEFLLHSLNDSMINIICIKWLFTLFKY